MIAVLKLYIEGTKAPFCEINLSHITKRQIDTVLDNANEWLEIVTEQVGSPKTDLACSRCADIIAILKEVLKSKNIKEFADEKTAIEQLLKKFSDLQLKSK